MSIRSEMVQLEAAFQAALVMAMAETGTPPWGEWGEVVVGPIHEPVDRLCLQASVVFRGATHPNCKCAVCVAVYFHFRELYDNQNTLDALVKTKAQFVVAGACEEWIAHQDPETAARRHAEQAADLLRMAEEDR